MDTPIWDIHTVIGLSKISPTLVEDSNTSLVGMTKEKPNRKMEKRTEIDSRYLTVGKRDHKEY